MQWAISAILVVVVIGMAVYVFRAPRTDTEYVEILGYSARRTDCRRLQADELSVLRDNYAALYQSPTYSLNDFRDTERIQSLVELIRKIRQANDQGRRFVLGPSDMSISHYLRMYLDQHDHQPPSS